MLKQNVYFRSEFWFDLVVIYFIYNEILKQVQNDDYVN